MALRCLARASEVSAAATAAALGPTQARPPGPLHRRRRPGPAFPARTGLTRPSGLGTRRNAAETLGGRRRIKLRSRGRLRRTPPAAAPQLALCGQRVHREPRGPRRAAGSRCPPAAASAPPAGPRGQRRPRRLHPHLLRLVGFGVGRIVIWGPRVFRFLIFPREGSADRSLGPSRKAGFILGSDFLHRGSIRRRPVQGTASAEVQPYLKQRKCAG